MRDPAVFLPEGNFHSHNAHTAPLNWLFRMYYAMPEREFRECCLRIPQ